MPETQIFGGGASESLIHPIVFVAMLITMVLIMILPRKYVIVPFVICAFLVPQGQQLNIGGMHWMVTRFLIMVGCLRLVVTKFMSQDDAVEGGFNSLDHAFLGYVGFQAIGISLQYMQVGAVINQLGYLVDFLGAYLLMRAWIRDEADIYRTLKCLAVITVIVGIGMEVEQRTLRNIFGMLGGVRATPDTRDGNIRSQGPFQVSILAGTFAATLLPMFVLLWKNGKAKFMAAAGLIGGTVMTVCSYSSTPLLAYAAAVLGVCLWPLRKSMRTVRWGIVAAIGALAMVMKAPVWFIIAHIDLTGGSSGWHRAELIDQFIRHFWDWWLIGTKTFASWGYDLWDQQDLYVNVGESGGLIALIFFIMLISRSFGTLGRARKLVDGDKEKEWSLWLLGAALFANCMGFFGVNYFDQTKISWFLLLASISAVTVPILARKTAPEAPTDRFQPELTRSRLEVSPSYEFRPKAVATKQGNALPPIPKPVRN